MRNWSNYVDSYIRYCEMRGLEKSTTNQRERELTKFGLWLKGKSYKLKSIKELDEKHVINYIKLSCQYKAKATTFGKLSVLNGFGEWLCIEGHWQKNPIQWIERPKLNSSRKIPRIQSRENLIKIYQETFNHHTQLFKYLYPAAFIIYYSTGMRKTELLGLKISDWNEKERSLKVTGYKTKTDRLVPLTKDAAHVLESYLNVRNRLLIRKGISSQEHIFLNRDGKRLSGTQIWKGLKNAALRAGIDNFTTHQLRHNCTSDLLESGVHLTKVQQILGHKCIESTFRYTHITDEGRAIAMSQHPINEILGVLNE